MRIAFDFNDDGNPYWTELDAVSRTGDTVSYQRRWYVITEVRWRPEQRDVLVFMEAKDGD